ncbi:MAG TPA: FtsX-like permease family protein [Actinomycetota bacterium]|nr:FtsX-like permease family protein [Actinomycetota bacterium]
MPNSAVGLCFRAQLRSRRGSWLGLGAVIGLVVSVSLAGVAGARRTASAYPRLEAATNPADAVVFDTTPNPQIPALDAGAVAALPQVAQAASMRVFDSFEGQQFANTFGSPGGDAFTVGRGINQLHLRSGRAADVSRANEVVVDYSTADRDHLRPGSRLRLRLVLPAPGGPQWIPNYQSTMPFTFTVVGVVATPGQFPPETGFYWSGPGIYVTPAFIAAHVSDLSYYDANVVRVRGGAPGVDALTAAVGQLTGTGFQPVIIPMGQQSAQTERSFHLQVVALWMLSGLLGLVALLVLIDLLVRQAVLESRDWRTLWAMGLGRGELVRLGLAGTAVTGGAAGVVAIAASLALSPLAPIGVIRDAETHPGLAFDALVLVPGAVGLLVLALAVAAVPLWRAARAATRVEPGEQVVQERPTVAGRVAAAGLPVAATAGVRMALEPGRGPTAVPVRSTLGGGIVGVAALVAALTFAVSLGHLVHTPRLYGVTWDTEVTNNNGPDAAAKGIDIIRSDPDVLAAAWDYNVPGTFSAAGRGSGADPVQTSIQVLDPVHGLVHPVIVAGREPSAPDEVALGIRTMQGLHLRIGDSLEASALDQGARPLAVRLVGQAVLEPGDSSGALGTGAVLTRSGLDRLAQGSTTFPPFIIAVQFKPGRDVGKATGELQDRLQALDENFGATSPQVPDTLVNFGQVRYLPYVLGGLLGLVALLVLVHLVVTAVRRRRRDLAILKTLGFTRAQVRRTVLWQATTLGLAVLVVGIPVGVGTGHWLWDLLANQQGILPEPATPILLIAAGVAAVLAAANLASLIPAALAGRTPPALVLRSE